MIMKKNYGRFIALFLYMCILSVIIYNSYDVTYAEDIQTTAQSYVLIESETCRILKDHNSSQELPMGTMNKLMTILLAAEAINEGKLSFDQELTASATANSSKGATIWLMTGEKMNVRDLIKGLIIGNANDAAVVFAEALGGDTVSFVEDMNRRADELGMKNTIFTAPGGVDDENQHTTSYDMALLTREVVKYDFLKEIMTTWLDYVRDGKTELVNENNLVRSYNGILGVKACHSEKFGYSLAAAAERNGETYIAVVLCCEDKDERFSVGKKLLNTGFSVYKTIIPGFSGEHMMPLKVRHGTDSAVETEAAYLPPLVIPKGSEGKMETIIFLPEYIDAPLKKGQCVGTIGFYAEETLLYETPLVTVSSVGKNTFLKSFKKIIVKMFK